MWKCYYTNQSKFKAYGYYINKIRVLQIQKISGPFLDKNIYRILFYDESGRYVGKMFEDDFEVAKLKGLLKLKEIGFNILTLNGEQYERSVS